MEGTEKMEPGGGKLEEEEKTQAPPPHVPSGSDIFIRQ